MRLEVITREEGIKLLSSYEVITFDWKRMTKYSFWIAVICIVTAAGAVLADEALMELFAKLFKTPPVVKRIFYAAVAAAFYYWGFRKRKLRPEKIFSTEAVFSSGSLPRPVASVSSARRSIREAGTFLSFFCWRLSSMVAWVSLSSQGLSGYSPSCPSEAGSALKPGAWRGGEPTIWA